MYDINGNKLIEDSGSSDILDFTTITEKWQLKATTAYNLLLDEYKKVPNSGIPFFISTDQHGAGMEQHRFVHNMDKDGMNLLSLNLGDTVQNKMIFAELDAALERVKDVKNYISVPGNHDYSGWQNVTKNPKYDINRYFIANSFQRHMFGEDDDSYVVYDTLHDVKIIALDDYKLDGTTILKSNSFNTKSMERIILELSKDDYDCMFIFHQPFESIMQSRTGSQVNYERPAAVTAFANMLKARKNKETGTITDRNGNVHNYDFTNCKKDLLCVFNGHEHAEVYSTDRSLVSYAAPNCSSSEFNCVFGLIDRVNNKLKIWKFNRYNNTDLLEIPLS